MNRPSRLAMILVFALAQSAALATEGGFGPADSVASDERRPPPAMVERYADTDELAVGDWLVSFRNFGWFAPNASVTGLAFGPGREELAYCTSDGTAGSSLWLAALRDLPQVNPWQMNPVTATQRLLWRAPEGRTLGAPLWWAPNASAIAVLARGDDTADLLSVDYVSGAAATLAHNANVVDLAWEPNARRLAYVTESDGAREVWLQTLPPGEPRRIGEGGINLRWSLDGALTWLRPDSDTSWSEALWDPQSEQARTIGSFPARTPAALRSPDGLLCADLAPAGGSDDKQLTIYLTGSRNGDAVPLPEAHAQRLLAWSPDSKLLLILARDGWLLAISAQPPGPSITRALRGTHGDIQDRVILAGLGRIDPASGAPAWDSASDLFAYRPYEGHLKWAFPHLAGDAPFGYVIVQSVSRKYYPPPQAEDLEKATVTSNMKNIALCLQMYLADNNDVFPSAGDTEALLPILDPYFKTSDIFMRPGTQDDLVVQYVVPPGARLVDVEDPVSMPIAVIDYASGFYTIGYADGHAATYDRTPNNDANLEDWWAELDALRAEDPNALPPPFPPED